MFGSKKAGAERIEPKLAEPIGVGDDVGQFFDECLEPKADSFVTLMQVWQRYQHWCGRQNLVPMAYPLFFEEFHSLATQILDDVKLIQYRGAHIFYKETALTPEAS